MVRKKSEKIAGNSPSKDFLFTIKVDRAVKDGTEVSNNHSETCGLIMELGEATAVKHGHPCICFFYHSPHFFCM